MSLRIVTTHEDTGAVLAVSGRLVAPWIAELERSFELCDGEITIDVSDLSFVGTAGIEVLRGFISRGAAVRGCSPYLVSQLYRGAP